MQLHDFIFSKNRKFRLTRHITFWLCWTLFSSCVQLTGFIPASTTLGNLIFFQVARTVSRLPPHILFCYLMVYFLVPRFIPKRKYKHFFFYLLFSVFLLYGLNYFYLGPLLDWQGNHFGHRVSPFTKLFFSFYSNINFTGPIPASCLMLAIKYYKDWYIKQRESEMLLRENKQAELQLLKAQVHPHFLFNTLNNIYSFTLTEHPQAANLVDKLSGMIDYMCTEGENSFVPLVKEIQLIQDYIDLEKVRYGDRLDMQVQLTGDYKNKIIAPLLMIPFVENCFKHGASKMRGRQWIKLLIDVTENELNFSLSNSKPKEAITTSGKKILGLSMSKKIAIALSCESYFKN